MILENDGLYWTPSEMKRLKNLVSSGVNWDSIAAQLRRTVSACKLRYYYIRVADLYYHGEPGETLSRNKK